MGRRFLLARLLAAALCVAAAENRARAIVTANVFGGNVLPPGLLINGDPLGDSVALITVTDGTDSFIGTGTLIGDGTQVLTAGHLLLGENDPSGTGTTFTATSATVTFDTPFGTFTNTTTDLTAHPAYQFNSTDRIGYDLGLLEFATPFSTSVPRQDILRDNSGVELTPTIGTPAQAVTATRVGYGVTGIGSVGFDPAAPGSGAGTRRAGNNLYDAPAGALGNENDRVLLYDFDGGVVSGTNTNVFGNLTFGAGETSAAFGDSGGPIFVNTNGQNLIAGVTSFGLTGITVGGVSTDVNPTLFASFGDVGGDVRVSDPLNQNFIDLLVNHDRLLGDTNNDGVLDSLDIDTLFAAIGGVADPWFDLNLDSVVDGLDVDALVTELFQTFSGDADLDGDVDGFDLDALSMSFGMTGSVGWSDGDFNGDGTVDGFDLDELAQNWAQSRDTSSFAGSLSFTSAAVPEPATVGLLLVGLVGVGCRRR